MARRGEANGGEIASSCELLSSAMGKRAERACDSDASEVAISDDLEASDSSEVGLADKGRYRGGRGRSRLVQPPPLLALAAEAGAVWTACREQSRPSWSIRPGAPRQGARGQAQPRRSAELESHHLLRPHEALALHCEAHEAEMAETAKRSVQNSAHSSADSSPAVRRTRGLAALQMPCLESGGAPSPTSSCVAKAASAADVSSPIACDTHGQTRDVPRRALNAAASGPSTRMRHRAEALRFRWVWARARASTRPLRPAYRTRAALVVARARRRAGRASSP